MAENMSVAWDSNQEMLTVWHLGREVVMCFVKNMMGISPIHDRSSLFGAAPATAGLHERVKLEWAAAPSFFLGLAEVFALCEALDDPGRDGRSDLPQLRRLRSGDRRILRRFHQAWAAAAVRGPSGHRSCKRQHPTGKLTEYVVPIGTFRIIGVNLIKLH